MFEHKKSQELWQVTKIPYVMAVGPYKHSWTFSCMLWNQQNLTAAI